MTDDPHTRPRTLPNSLRWWLAALFLNRIDTESHTTYRTAKSKIEGSEYLPSRLPDILRQTELTWRMADEGLVRIHERMDKLLTTCLAIFGLVASAMQIGRVPLSAFSYTAIGILAAACALLLVTRLPMTRFAPTDLPLITRDSCRVDSEDFDEWQFVMAMNYYLARIEADIASRVRDWQMRMTIALMILALLFLIASV